MISQAELYPTGRRTPLTYINRAFRVYELPPSFRFPLRAGGTLRRGSSTAVFCELWVGDWYYNGTNNGAFDLFTYNGINIPTSGQYYLYFVSNYAGNPGASIPNYFGPRLDAVPEPASLLALGAGLVGMLALRRRQAHG